MTTSEPVTLGNHIFELDDVDFESRQARVLHLMARALNRRNGIAFVGSGLVRSCGYPTWTEFIRALLLAAIKTRRSDASTEALNNAAMALDSDANPDARTTALNQCELLLKDQLHEVAAQTIEAHLAAEIKEREPRYDSIDALVGTLGFRRFVTTNYDETIEAHLARLPRHLTALEDVQAEKLRLVARTDGAHEILRFAAAPTDHMGVLHLHGVLRDPSTMIVTERDYQRVYARDTPETRSYREALDVLFSGNANFFFGLGMDEPDLLQSLRRYVSTRTPAYEHRAVFAVLPTRGKRREELAAWWTTLNRRYGLITYFYESGADPSVKEFVAAVGTIKEAWQKWWKEWRRKPHCRSVVKTKEALLSVNTIPVGASERSTDLDVVVARVLRTKLLLLLGRPGAGKGSLAVHLGSDERVAKRFTRRVIITTHFATEFFSAIEAAVQHFDGSGLGGDCIDRLEAALLQQDYPRLLVLAGVERLLSRAPAADLGEMGTWSLSQGRRILSRPPLPLGVAASGEAQRLLSVLARVAKNPAFQGCIVLCSSTVPLQLLDELRERTEDLVVLKGEDPGLAPTGPNDSRTKVSRALRGHRYALHVLDHAHPPGPAREAWLDTVWTRITPAPVPQRAEDAVESAIRSALETCSHPAAAYDALRIVALVATPVSPASLAAIMGRDGYDEKAARHLLEEWRKRGILLSLGNDGPYTAHTVVRSLILRRLDAQPEVHGEPRRLGVVAWTAEGSISHAITPAMHREMVSGVDRLLRQVAAGTLAREQGLSAAFGLVRTCWSASDLARLHAIPTGEPYPYTGVPHYPSYQRRVFRILNLLRALGTWDWQEENARDNAPLERDEVAWLYTEAALAAYAQGSTQDSYSLFLMAKHMSEEAEREQRGHRWCQGEINLAMVQIERARLGRARQHLENAYTVARELADLDAEARVRLFLGLLFHLAGDTEQALQLYQLALEHMRRLSNRRGLSIVCRHLADLHRYRSNFLKAEEFIREAIASAEGGYHLDLAWYARIADANLRLSRGNTQPHEAIEPALTFAKQMGSPRLEADVYKVQAQIALQNGETELATRLASRALAIANVNGMQLRVIAALGLLGKIAGVRGHVESAVTLLQTAIQMGRRSGYLLQVEASMRDMLALQASRRGCEPLV